MKGFENYDEWRLRGPEEPETCNCGSTAEQISCQDCQDSICDHCKIICEGCKEYFCESCVSEHKASGGHVCNECKDKVCPICEGRCEIIYSNIDSETCQCCKGEGWV